MEIIKVLKTKTGKAAVLNALIGAALIAVGAYVPALATAIPIGILQIGGAVAVFAGRDTGRKIEEKLEELLKDKKKKK